MVDCILHGSFRKHLKEIENIHRIFTNAGINVVGPVISEVVGEKDGFVQFATDKDSDPRMVELMYLSKQEQLRSSGFSYFVNPNNTLGTSAAFEFGFNISRGIRSFFLKPLGDLPGYVQGNSVWKPESLADYIMENGFAPQPIISPDEKRIYNEYRRLVSPNPVPVAGALIEDHSRIYKSHQERDLLFVETHKWGGMYSIVGGRVLGTDSLQDTLRREVFDQVGLQGEVTDLIYTFNEIPDAGYFISETNRMFSDFVVRTSSRLAQLDGRAQGFVWMPASVALRDLPLEPNAKKIVEKYQISYLNAA